MKLTKKLKNGKYAVNKSAVIAALKKRLAKKDGSLPGLLPVSDREIAAEATELTRYNADSLLNHNEE